MSALDAIRARLAAATPGPWAEANQGGGVISQHPETVAAPANYKDGHVEYYGGAHVAESIGAADQDLIIHAPADLALLLRLIDRAATLLESDGYTVTAARLRAGEDPDLIRPTFAARPAFRSH